MRKLLVQLSILVLILIGGSGQSDSEAEKRQFIEILSENNQLVGIMEDSKSIEEFTKKLDIESWEYCDDLVNDAKLIYTYIGYEVVDDTFYLEGKDPYIIKNNIELYEDGSDFYIVEYTEGCKYIVKVTKSTGRFLSAPEKLNISTKKTEEDIINKWKAEIDSLKDWSESSEVDDDSDEDFDIITESDVKKSSKEQRLDILDNQNQVVIYSTSEISEITNYLNALCENEWEEVQEIPDIAIVERNIIRYALKRKTSDHELVEVSRKILYMDKEDYYFEDIIPNNGEQKQDYTIYYKIPKETAQYICSQRDK